jgi:hypothetical protein
MFQTNAFVYVSSGGGVFNNLTSSRYVQVRLLVDGLVRGNADSRTVSVEPQGLAYWQFDQVLTVSPGRHTISVDANQPATPLIEVSGGPGSVLQGGLTTLILKK